MVIRIVQYIFEVLSLIVLVDVILSYFMSPFHPIRVFLDRIVQPMLMPIRRVVPSLMNIDFSPVILLILLQIIESILIRIL